MHPAFMTELIPSRPLQRSVLIGLCGLSLLATAWTLIRPIQPPLPLLPTVDNLPGDWTVISNSAQTLTIPPGGPRRFHPFGSKVALGPSQILVRPDGNLLRLTPFSSWTQARFTLENALEASPEISDRAEASCLSRKGSVGRTNLHYLIGSNDKPLSRLQRYWHLILPITNRSYSCILISTTAIDVLDGSSSSLKLLAHLTNVTTWPDPPGLSNRQIPAE